MREACYLMIKKGKAREAALPLILTCYLIMRSAVTIASSGGYFFLSLYRPPFFRPEGYSPSEVEGKAAFGSLVSHA